MNQILFTGNKNDNIQASKIIKVFCFIIIIFSICLIGKGIYGIVQNDDGQIAQSNIKPKVDISSQGRTAKIKVNHEITIKSIVYSLNNGEEMQISDASGRKNVNAEVQLPNEDTTIKVKIIDNNNNEYNVVKEFLYDKTIDIEEPKIEISSTITMSESISVVATDNEEISYITYKWDDDEEVKIENDGSEKTRMEARINLEEGKQKLVVKAVDHNGNETSKQKDIVVVSPPEITLKRNKGELIIRVTDKEEVTKVVYEINGNEYTKENTGDNKQEFEIRELLSKGENIVKVTAYNKYGVTTEKLGKCTY